MTYETYEKLRIDRPTDGVLRANKAGNPPPLRDVAIWQPGDPRYDYDLEARPTVGQSWAGADEPQ